MVQVIKINPQFPEDEKIQQAAEVILAGGVVSCPTETFYGLAANALNHKAVNKIYLIKQRVKEKPLIVLISDSTLLPELGVEVNPISQKYIDTYWPGILTLIFKTSNTSLPLGIKGKNQTIAIRMTSYSITKKLIDKVGSPITATSANLSGYPSPSTIDMVIGQLGTKIDLIIDAGPTEGKFPSTIIDVSGDTPRLIRKGAGNYNLITTNN